MVISVRTYLSNRFSCYSREIGTDVIKLSSSFGLEEKSGTGGLVKHELSRLLGSTGDKQYPTSSRDGPFEGCHAEPKPTVFYSQPGAFGTFWRPKRYRRKKPHFGELSLITNKK